MAPKVAVADGALGFWKAIGEGAARQTLSPRDRADPGLASVRGLDWLGPEPTSEGSKHGSPQRGNASPLRRSPHS